MVNFHLNLTQNHSTEVVLSLLEAGADPNLADNEGNAALHYYSGIEDHEIVKACMKKGADLSKRNIKGWLPMQF